MTRRFGDWCQTFTGREFWPLDPRGADVCIEDIAHALSLLCRFGGHCRVFYSVAEHCVRVSEIVVSGEAQTPTDCLAGLLHDASEAYLIDVPRPIKPWLGGYREIEARVQAVVNERFGLPADAHEQPYVKHADEVLLTTEARDLMLNTEARWKLRAAPMHTRIVPWSAERAEAAFLARFREVTAGAPDAR